LFFDKAGRLYADPGSSYFLQQTPPFDDLAPHVLESLCRELTVVYFASGEEQQPEPQLMLIRSGLFALHTEQQRLTHLQTGDYYGYQLLLTGLADPDTIRCEEDGLVYFFLRKVLIN